MSSIAISIVIPCYNQGNCIMEAVKSVELCPDKNLYEIIIVNDGSTDIITLNVLNKLSIEGYNVINQTNRGLGAARNAGIKAAAGKYILPLDCDNKIKPEYIFEGIRLLDNYSSIDVVYGNAEYFGEKKGTWLSEEFNLQHLMIENYIDACAVFRKSTWEKLGGYDENMPVMGAEDWDLWLRIAFDGGKFMYLNKIFFEYYYSSKSMIRSRRKEYDKLLNDYIQKKFHNYLNKSYLNKVIYTNISKRKILMVHILLKTTFPGLHRLFIKEGIIKENNLI